MMEACSSRFTAAEGGARLAAAAAIKNILAVEYHSFIPVRLLYEKAFQIRGALSGGNQRSVYVTRATRIHVVAYELKILTDLDTICAESYDAVSDWTSELELKEVLICTAAVLQRILAEQLLTVHSINVMIIDSCHLIYTDDNLKYIMRLYKACPLLNRPVILALTYPLFAAPKKEVKKEISLQNSQEIITIKCQEEIMRDKGNETELGVYVNVDDFDLYEMLEWKIEQLENELCCQMDLAEDIDVGKRVSSSQTKPRELIIEYSHRSSTDDVSEEYKDLERFMMQTIEDAMEFMEDHRHDPTEIYGEELYEEFMNIPDPSVDPKLIFNQFLYILQQFGPYAADKAAFALLTKLEKLKVKVPYERHFLLLGLCTTVFVKIRGYADYVFSKFDDDWQKIKTFSTPKVLRFAEILETFNPPASKNNNLDDSYKQSPINQYTSNNRDDITKKLHNDIDKCDFKTLGNRIQDTINIYEANLNEINYYLTDICKTKSSKTNIPISRDCSSNVTTNSTFGDKDINLKGGVTDIKIDRGDTNITGVGKSYIIDNKLPESFLRALLPRRTAHRTRGRIRIPRNNITRVLMQQNPDTLCGIVYMKDALVAKIMFMIIVDMSRCNPRLSYLCAQYCATENPANPETELKECQRQGKKQEEVLKKFRMHECNLLLATSALEEGIDLPRCNLVLRWDVPSSYRSYGLCRDRARAPRATAALLCSYSTETTESLLHNIATYRELDQVIGRKCGCGVQDEPPQEEEDHADRLNSFISPYTPNEGPNNGTEIYERSGFSVTKDSGRINEIDKTKIIDNDNRNVLTNIALSDDNDTQLIINSINSRKDDTTNLNEYKTDVKFDIIVDGNKDIVDQNEDNGKYKRMILNVTDHRSHEREAKNNLKAKKNLLNALDTSVNNIDKISKSNNIYDSQGCINGHHNLFINTNNNIEVNISDIANKMAEIKIGNSLHQNGWDISYLDKKPVLINNSEYNAKSEISILSDVINDNVKEQIDESNDFKPTINIPIPIIAKEDKEINNMSKLENYVSDIKENIFCNKCCDMNINECSCVPKDSNNIKNDISKNDNKKSLNDNDNASVDLNTAITFINRYCGKLPSDTFTRLAPQWWMETVQIAHKDTKEMKTAYICTLRLPLNCPVKYNIVGHPMPTRVLARRMVALQACRILHKSGELDNQLMPIGKENFNVVEQETSNSGSTDAPDNSDSARPGTTKRRQYYFKRTAWAFTDCQPVVDIRDSDIYPCEQLIDEKGIEESLENQPNKLTGTKRNMLYAIVSSLWCALPERYNTRGRRLHAPQNASQAIGILMAREEPDNLQIPAFPVYTRSGEVRVSVEYVPDADVRLSPRRERLVRRFMRFVFAEVLRVRRRGMRLQSDGSTHNNYYIVPTIKSTRPDGTTKIDIDWTFLQLIYDHTEYKKTSSMDSTILWEKTEDEDNNKQTKVSVRERRNKVKNMENPLLKQGEVFVFDAEKYKEAVVTPWYRNQDQPQFFLVAEICWNLTPDSSFPSVSHASFRDYYTCKYGVTLTQRQQPLLDVDHTSARLNLLTPRYVNRKGVALPVSSERTRRAKRDRLDQKQILVPELCRVHPFAAPLWFATVALPCVLYRINALLIADEIRRSVAIDVGLGIPKINEKTMPGFQWPALDFGWSLAEVLNADFEKNEKKKEEEETKKEQREKDLRERNEKKDKEVEIEKEDKQQECKEKTINDILQEKEEAAGSFEIGTWSNDMAAEIPEDSEYDEFMEPLPPNLTFCTSASGGKNWCDPIEKPKYTQHSHNKMYSMVDSDCSYISSDLDSDDTDLDYEGSDDDADNGFCCYKNTNMAMGVRIEYKTAHEAEAVDLERTKKMTPAPMPDEADDALDREEHEKVLKTGVAPKEYIERFRASVVKHKFEIVDNGNLITKDKSLDDILPEYNNKHQRPVDMSTDGAISELFPYCTDALILRNGQVDIASVERNKRIIMEGIKKRLTKEDLKKLNCFSMKDIDIDSPEYVNEKVVNVGFDNKENYKEMCKGNEEFTPYYVDGKEKGVKFDFDYQPKLEGHPGPSPSVILQALTMSNANDGINLERLETIGDSFLKFAITAYLYCAHPTVHEGKLSHMRSKQVSNLNLYRLGRNKRLGARMIASKFEPHDNWLPPCHKPPPTLQPGSQGDINIESLNTEIPLDAAGCFIPYNLITQHSIPDKSIADCVEALIGAYLLECGPRGALLFMSWLGIKVLPCHHVELESDHPYVVAANNTRTQEIPSLPVSPRRCGSTSSSECSSSDEEPQQHQDMYPDLDWSWPGRAVGSLRPYVDHRGVWMQPVFGELKAPPSPLLRYIEDPEGELEQMLSGYDALERTLQYRFKDRSLLLQALTHASHHSNRLTDCYQRLEFLGDAILDYLITRHLYEDPRRHSPGALTDLRSALVNNTIFATLAARHGFHKYFRHMSPGLNEVLTKYVKIQEENGHSISEEHYLIQEDEMEQAEDVEVPKALGDLFESVAGAIFLDSGMSLAAVWKSYVNLMGAELEAFSAAAPKSPVRELLEAEPDTAKFGKPERLADGRRVRVCVEVFGRGTFKGIGRNHRIAKGTAARCALRHLRIHRGY